MFKEVVFELSGGECRSKHTARLFHNSSLSARLQVLHATPESTWELIEVSGDAGAIATLRATLDRGPEPPMRGLEIVAATPRTIQYVVHWARPGPDEPSVSIEFILYDTVGPDAIFSMRIERERAEVKAAGPDGAKLFRFFDEVRRRLEGRFEVRLVRMGELKPGWGAAHPKSGFREEDRRLVALALSSGYYDNPKRCGVRELGDALGYSKSVVARKLRNIERRALESLVRPSEPAPMPPGPLADRAL